MVAKHLLAKEEKTVNVVDRKMITKLYNLFQFFDAMSPNLSFAIYVLRRQRLGSFEEFILILSRNFGIATL